MGYSDHRETLNKSHGLIMKSQITIHDYPCGSGKTTGLYNSFNSERSYIVVVPYLTEIERLLRACTHLNFVQPTIDLEAGLETKTESLIQQVREGKNIVCTHSIYPRLSQLADDGLLENYEIVIDEVPDCVSTVCEKSPYSVKEIYISAGFISVDETGRVHPTEKWLNNHNAAADTLNPVLFQQAKSGGLYLLNNSLFINCLPLNILSKCKKVTVLTYMSQGSYFTYYLKFSGVEYEVNESRKQNIFFKEEAKRLITLKPMNALRGLNLSNTGQAKSLARPSDYNRVSSCLKNLRSRDLKGVDQEKILITSKKDAWFENTNNRSKAGKFAKNSKLFNARWIANKTRGTNDFADCSHLIYLYDQHPNPYIARWLGADNKCFSKHYALTELIQWVWRSRIRKKEDITLYLPSERMYEIFSSWLYSEE